MMKQFRRFLESEFQTDSSMASEHRNATGSFYTPFALAKWMCRSSLLAMAAERGITEISKEGLEDFKSLIGSLKVLDPACGSGVFPGAYLETTLELFLEFSGREAEYPLESVLKGLFFCEIQQTVLNQALVNLCRFADLESHAFHGGCGDALEDAFWESNKSFQKASAEGFDLVIGNPPYLGEKSNKALFQGLRQTDFGKRYYEGRMDYFYYFIYRGVECLRPGGRLSYITTNYFPTADGAAKLRQFLRQEGEVLEIVNFSDTAVFREAMGQNNMIMTYQKGKQSDLAKSRPCQIWEAVQKKSTLEQWGNPAFWKSVNRRQDALYDAHGLMQIYGDDQVLKILSSIEKGTSDTLGDWLEVNQGIVSGADRSGESGIFALSESEAAELSALRGLMRPFYKNRDVRRYAVHRTAKDVILYIAGDETFEALEEEALQRHLMPYKEKLEKRREVVLGRRPWYALQWPRESELFQGPLLVAPQRAYVNVFAYSDAPVYGSADIYYLKMKSKGASALSSDQVSQALKFYMGFLNTRLVYFWLYYAGKRKGSMLELYATPLKKIPIPRYDPSLEGFDQLMGHIESLYELARGGRGITDAAAAQVQCSSDWIEDWFSRNLGLTQKECEILRRSFNQCVSADLEKSYWLPGVNRRIGGM